MLMENTHGLIVGAQLTEASETAERAAALSTLESHWTGERRITVGDDKGFDVRIFIAELRARHHGPICHERLSD